MRIHAQIKRGPDVKVDAVVKLIWSKVWITKAITFSSQIRSQLWVRCAGEAIVGYLALFKGGSRVHFPRMDLEATIEGRPLSKGGHYPRVAPIQGWPLSKGGHYARVDHGSTIQGWPLSKCGTGVHYPRVATIQGLATIQGWPLSKGRQLGIFKPPGTQTSIENLSIDLYLYLYVSQMNSIPLIFFWALYACIWLLYGIDHTFEHDVLEHDAIRWRLLFLAEEMFISIQPSSFAKRQTSKSSRRPTIQPVNRQTR